MFHSPRIASYRRISRHRRFPWLRWLVLFFVFLLVKLALLLAPFAFAWSYVQVNGMPYLRYDYTYTRNYDGTRVYSECTYLNGQSVRVTHGPDCPLIAFMK